MLLLKMICNNDYYNFDFVDGIIIITQSINRAIRNKSSHLFPTAAGPMPHAVVTSYECYQYMRGLLPCLTELTIVVWTMLTISMIQLAL